jgi:hypothetical protein
MRPKPTGWEIVGKFAVGIAAVVVTAIIRGLVLVALWGWFVEPLGVRSINVAEAIGLAILVGMLWQKAPEDESADRRSTWEKFATAFFASVFMAGFALLLGWIVHFFL